MIGMCSLDGRSWTTTDAIPREERRASLEGSLMRAVEGSLGHSLCSDEPNARYWEVSVIYKIRYRGCPARYVRQPPMAVISSAPSIA